MNRRQRRDNFKTKSRTNYTKWIGIGLGTLVGISHIGMIGMLANRTKMPAVNLPVGPYTSYQVHASEDGYSINYRANDPKVMEVTKDINRPGGFLGLGKTKIQTKELYTMDGSRHLEKRPVGKSISDQEVACIKAEGSGEGTGRMVGGSIGAAVGTSGLASIPYVGWVLAGAATVLGMEQGAEIGGQMAKDFADC
jgi:hypothetical protein